MSSMISLNFNNNKIFSLTLGLKSRGATIAYLQRENRDLVENFCTVLISQAFSTYP
jgi:hypothetical protein